MYTYENLKAELELLTTLRKAALRDGDNEMASYYRLRLREVQDKLAYLDELETLKKIGVVPTCLL